MLELRFARYWRMASLIGLLLVLAVTLVPPDWLFLRNAGARWLISDKWLHGITFTLLAIWFCGQYARTAYWRVAVGLLAFGALIEICQQAVTYRSSELNDLLANLAGIATGLLLAALGVGGWSARFENWIERRHG
jgi:hypothetical protein